MKSLPENIDYDIFVVPMRYRSQRGRVELVEFEWRVQADGYRWISAIDYGPGAERLSVAISDQDTPAGDPRRSSRMLIPINPVGSAVRRYNPLENEPGLHRQLAHTELSERGILEFANQYGLLSLDNQKVDVTDVMNVDGRLIVDANCIADWKAEIVALRDAIAEWDDTKKNVSAKISDHVNALIKPRLELLKAVLLPSSEGTGVRIGLRPTNLASAAWLQFARETEGSFEIAQCPECQRWFEYFPQQIKTPRIFCSQSCRSKAYRKRQIRALLMLKEGHPIDEVARMLGSEPRIVAAWLKRVRAGLKNK